MEVGSPSPPRNIERFLLDCQGEVLGILFGLAVGFALAFLVAYLQHGYYFEIILPGSIVGMIVGYATQRYGAAPTPATR